MKRAEPNPVTNHPLHHRLRYLRNAEALLALAIPGALAWHWQGSGAAVDWALRLPPMALVGLMLLQGAWYWHLKLLSVQSRQPLPVYFRPLYVGLRRADLLALVALAIWLAAHALRSGATVDLAWAGALWAFAVLEYVNYFAVQLMHDTSADFEHLRRNRRLRRAALASDLARGEEAN